MKLELRKRLTDSNRFWGRNSKQLIHRETLPRKDPFVLLNVLFVHRIIFPVEIQFPLAQAKKYEFYNIRHRVHEKSATDFYLIKDHHKGKALRGTNSLDSHRTWMKPTQWSSRRPYRTVVMFIIFFAIQLCRSQIHGRSATNSLAGHLHSPHQIEKRTGTPPPSSCLPFRLGKCVQ